MTANTRLIATQCNKSIIKKSTNKKSYQINSKKIICINEINIHNRIQVGLTRIQQCKTKKKNVLS